MFKSADLGRGGKAVASLGQWHEKGICEVLLPSCLYIFPMPRMSPGSYFNFSNII